MGWTTTSTPRRRRNGVLFGGFPLLESQVPHKFGGQPVARGHRRPRSCIPNRPPARRAAPGPENPGVFDPRPPTPAAFTALLSVMSRQPHGAGAQARMRAWRDLHHSDGFSRERCGSPLLIQLQQRLCLRAIDNIFSAREASACSTDPSSNTGRTAHWGVDDLGSRISTDEQVQGPETSLPEPGPPRRPPLGAPRTFGMNLQVRLLPRSRPGDAAPGVSERRKRMGRRARRPL
jgi:hypothetical protein